ncbi:hypothetical protein N9878_02255 [bacterium]|nr:hypothetical protein [bacterium]
MKRPNVPTCMLPDDPQDAQTCLAPLFVLAAILIFAAALAFG